MGVHTYLPGLGSCLVLCVGLHTYLPGLGRRLVLSVGVQSAACKKSEFFKILRLRLPCSITIIYSSSYKLHFQTLE